MWLRPKGVCTFCTQYSFFVVVFPTSLFLFCPFSPVSINLQEICFKKSIDYVSFTVYSSTSSLFCSSGFLSDNLASRNVLEKGTFLKGAISRTICSSPTELRIADHSLDHEGSGLERAVGPSDPGSQIFLSWHDLRAWKRPLSECQKMPVCVCSILVKNCRD